MAAKKVDVYSLLRKKYPETECVLLEEVSDKTGFRNRSCDYMVINLWPSRGLSIIGIEQKSYRSDWLSELKNPNKQEAHFKYCDFFYLLTTDENIAKLEEIPTTWGWMHIKGGKIHILKDAPKLSPEPVNRSMLCSMLRRAADKTGFIRAATLEETIEERVQERLNNERTYNSTERLKERIQYLEQRMQTFREHTGIDLDNRWGDEIKDIATAVNTLIQVDKHRLLLNNVQNMKANLSKHIESLEQLHTYLTNKNITDADQA